ncbi:MAG: transposase [Candidatus Liptonbacteria bacterium]|nr:transposase [Candidatus Liptonbacteria bacterium]
MVRNIVAGKIYHVLNRGVDKRDIFLNDEDRLRFIHDLFEFNDENPLQNVTYNFKVIARPNIGREGKLNRTPRKLLVEILAFCIMPNHYHLMLKPRSGGGVTKFMKRLNMGYARYFNEKYERSGALFEGRFKSVAVANEAHFLHLPYYIHFNPLDLAAPGWRNREIKDYRKTLNFLKKYRWSSHLDYLGIKNFPSITSREFLLDFFGGHKEYERKINEWLKDIDLENLKEVALE